MNSSVTPKKELIIVTQFPILTPRMLCILISIRRYYRKIMMVFWDRDGKGAVDFPEWLEAKPIQTPCHSNRFMRSRDYLCFGKHAFQEIRNSTAGIIHVTQPFLILIALLAKKKDQKVVYDVCEFFVDDVVQHLSHFTLLAREIGLFLERRLVKRVDSVLCVDSHKGWLCQNYRKANPNVYVLWNLPSLRLPEIKPPPRYPHGVQHPEKTALYVGGISPHKGILVMLDACSRVVRKVPKFKLLVVGKVWNEDEFQSIVDKLGIKRNVKHVDWVYPSSLHHYGKIASLGLLIDQNRKHLELGGLGQGRKLFTNTVRHEIC